MAMTPEEKTRMETLEQTVERIANATDTSFVAELNRRLGGVSITLEAGASLTGMNIAVRDVTDTGSETVADDYTGALTLTDNQGNTYKIGYY